ncbi:unnamed protein product [Orchesella dallaii]|uniref:CRAL-TRIO domain-containing protein n=1 Tax=Orchesella dallaii TaxID=48710 RepID=A0ABP1R5B9_9HEXA
MGNGSSQLKINAEVRFNEYPEVFPENPPIIGYRLQAEGYGGILKARDKFGRRIMCFNTAEWNPDEVSMDQLTASLTFLMDRLILDKDAINNGMLFLQNCDGFGWKHAKQYTLHAMKRHLNIFWYSYPIKFKGVYYVNCPSYVGYLYKMIKPFLKKKIQERIFILTKDKSFEMLHEKLPPKILPKFLGGDIENDRALEILELQPIK